MRTHGNTALEGHLLVLVGIRHELDAIGAPPQQLEQNARAIQAVHAELLCGRLDFGHGRE